MIACIRVGTECSPRTTHRKRVESNVKTGDETYANTFVTLSVSHIDQRFGAYVVNGPHLGFSHHTRRLFTNRLRDTEINQFQHALHEEEVRWLEIAVDDVVFVNRVHGRQHLLPSEANEVEIERLVPMLNLVQVRFQV